MVEDDFVAIIDRINELLKSYHDPDEMEPGGWSIREITGHLFDSLNNNYQRLLRYVPGGQLDFPGYDQELFVKRANYSKFNFITLLNLWYNGNKLLLHIYRSIPPEDARTSTIKIGDRPELTIEQLLKSYLDHAENHERQILNIIQSQTYALTYGDAE
jgi:hypothetical protein